MNALDSYLIAGIAATILLFGAAALGLLAASARRTRRALAALHVEVQNLKREVEAATAIGVRVGERLRRIETTTGHLGDRLGQIELRGEGRPYDQAIALVQRGADADRLVRNFGLSRGEADLVTRLHRPRAAG